MPPSATASIGEKSKVLVEAGHVAPRAEKRKVALEAYKTRVAREGIKNLFDRYGNVAALEPGYGCRSVLIRWLSSLDQRLSPLRATDSSQFDQNENVLRRSSPAILYNVASNENIILQRTCARRVFLREKRSRFLGQGKI